MGTFECLYLAFFILFVYLIVLLGQKRNRLLLPSVTNSIMWCATIFLILCQLNGVVVSKHVSENVFNHSARMILYMSIASTVAFIYAHIFFNQPAISSKPNYRTGENLQLILKRFRWIPWLCLVVGVCLLFFLISIMGSWENFGKYREIAVSTERTGWIAPIQRVSGHLSFLGTFYLMLLGYFHGITRFNLKVFLLYFFLCSAINMAIGGRVWILSSSLPYFSTFILGRHNTKISSATKNDLKKLVIVAVIFISLFSLIGILRSDNNVTENGGRGGDKFLYLTDGARMTNMMINQYPEGSYQYEYGSSTLLQNIVDSPMRNAFQASLSYDIGLSVTVKSVMPPLYYDFGMVGGAIFWGFICFLLEIFALISSRRNTILSIIVYGELCTMISHAPVGHIVSITTPAFEWILIIFFFRKDLFKGITPAPHSTT